MTSQNAFGYHDHSIHSISVTNFSFPLPLRAFGTTTLHLSLNSGLQCTLRTGCSRIVNFLIAKGPTVFVRMFLRVGVKWFLALLEQRYCYFLL